MGLMENELDRGNGSDPCGHHPKESTVCKGWNTETS